MTASDTETSHTPAKSIMIGLALGAAMLSAGNQMITVFLIRFMTDDLAIAPAIATGIFAVVRLYDGFIDPFIGYASDRTKTRWGRRFPYLVMSAVLTPISLVGIFAIPQFSSQGMMIGWLALMLIAHGTAYSLYAVPSSAIIVEATEGYHARSTVLAFRTYGGFAGQLIGSTLPAWVLAAWGGGRAGHADMVWLIGAIVLALGVASLPLLRRARGATPLVDNPVGFFGQLLTAWRCQPFRIMIGVHIVFMMGVATGISSNAHFTRYVLERTDAWLGTFYVLMSGANLLAVPLWLMISRKLDKKNAYIIALSMYGLGLLSWMLSGPDEPIWLLSGRVILIGAFMSGVILLASSMLTDAIRYDYVQSGDRREGAFTGMMSLVDKSANAVGLIGMGLVLSVTGYVASSDGGAATQSDGAILGILICYSLFPAATALISILMLRGYKLKREDLDQAPALPTSPSGSDEAAAEQPTRDIPA